MGKILISIVNLQPFRVIVHCLGYEKFWHMTLCLSLLYVVWIILYFNLVNVSERLQV